MQTGSTNLVTAACRSVTDLRPRKMDVEQCTLLCNLAELVARGMENASSYMQESISNSQAAADLTPPSPSSGSQTTPTDVYVSTNLVGHAL